MSSPNFELSKAVLSLGDYQLTSGKGNAGGYAGLNGSTLIDPAKFLPGFGGAGTGAAEGSFWVKSGTSLTALSGTTFTSNALTIGGVLMGITSSGVYGIKQTDGSLPLVLLGGANVNKVWIGSGQTLLGGNAGTYTNTSNWSITELGVCIFKATTFGGAVAMGGFNITSTGTIGSATLLLNCNTGGISSSGTLALTATSGVTVPTVTGTLPTTSPTFNKAVNFASANEFYGRLGAANTWTSAQTFNAKPIFGSGANLIISDTSGLQTALDDRLQKIGGAMTGAIAMGNHLITGLATPSDGTDAATKAYVDGKTITSNGGILNDLAIVVSGGGGNVLQKTMSGSVTTLTLAKASTSTSGYLSSTDYNTFKAAGDLSGVTISPNLVLSGPATIGVAAALPVYRSLVPADLATSVLKTINYTTVATACAANATTETAEIPFTGAAVGDFVTVSLPVAGFTANISVSAYVSSTANVKVRYANHTAASITLTVNPAQVIKIGIIKFV